LRGAHLNPVIVATRIKNLRTYCWMWPVAPSLSYNIEGMSHRPGHSG
jgi:hypothetical protein